ETSRLRPGDQYRRSDLIHQRDKGMNVAVSFSGQAERRYQLTRIRVEGFDRKLGIGIRCPVRGAETERCPCSLKGVLVYPIDLAYRYVPPNGRNDAPDVIPRASTVHIVYELGVKPFFNEESAPTFPSIGG